jgi:hypothetical protein
MAVVGRTPREKATLIVVGVSLAIILEFAALQAVTTSLSQRTTVEANPGPRLYTVTFIEGTICYPPIHPMMWGVTLGDVTKTQPPNVTLSQIEANSHTDDKFNATTITFSVPPGEYTFALFPSFMHLASVDGSIIGGQTGLLTVSDLNVTIHMAGLVPCT